MLFEGAQATLLDLDHGTYPFVTSSSACAGGAAVGPRRAAHAHRRRHRHRQGLHAPASVPGRSRARSAAPWRTTIREKGHEYGASTGRPRRCGWFDSVVVRYATVVNGFDTLAITKLDVLDELAEIPVCTGYRVGSDVLDSLPGDLSILETLRAGLRGAAGLEDPDGGDAELRRAARRRQTLPRPPLGAVRRPGGHRLDEPGPGRHDPAIDEPGRGLVRLRPQTRAFAAIPS